MKYIYILLMIVVYLIASYFNIVNNGVVSCVFAVLIGLTMGEIWWREE